MKIRKSVTAKLVFATSGGLFILMMLTAYFVVRAVSDMSTTQLSKDIENLINLHAKGMEDYFQQHAIQIENIFRNDALINWFTEHKVRGEAVGTAKFEMMKEIFSRETESHNGILSVFFGSIFTGEYFHEKGIYSRADYDVRTRPWWNDVKDTDDWTIGTTFYDPEKKIYYISLNYPVYSFANEFIGAGGADIYLQAVTDIAASITYQNTGRAFLIHEDGDLVSFRDEKIAIPHPEKNETINLKLNKLDERTGNKGFASLMQQMQSNASGVDQIQWRDNDYYVQFQSVKVDKINLNWKLALMVPQEVINAPVQKTISSAVIIILGIALVSIIILFLSARALLKPLLHVKNAMAEISGGDGDLSQRLEVHSVDEIGELANACNRFIKQVRNIVRSVQDTSRQIQKTTNEVSKVSKKTLERTEHSQQQMETTTNKNVEHMNEMASVMNEKIATATDVAKIAHKTSKKGRVVLEKSIEGLEVLNEDFDDTVITIIDLKNVSESIGAVMDVIRAVAVQTNLLALNAAIESARAGEQGRGFAVVADEVRLLAQRTQESTISVQKIIETLQNNANISSKSMQTTKVQVNKHMDDTRIVHNQLSEIASVVNNNKNNMQIIVDIIDEQNAVTKNISQVVAAVNKQGDETNLEAKHLMAICNGLEQNTTHLLELVGRFKV